MDDFLLKKNRPLLINQHLEIVGHPKQRNPTKRKKAYKTQPWKFKNHPSTYGISQSSQALKSRFCFQKLEVLMKLDIWFEQDILPISSDDFTVIQFLLTTDRNIPLDLKTLVLKIEAIIRATVKNWQLMQIREILNYTHFFPIPFSL